MNAEQIIKKYDSLKSDRSTAEAHWQECADFVLPRKNDIISEKPQGEKKGQMLFDSTAAHNNELLAGFLAGELTNPAALWFELTTEDEDLDADDKIKAWLQKITRQVHTAINSTNFQTEIHELYIDLTTFGTSPMLIEDDDDSLFRFSSRNVSEVLAEEDNKGRIDTIYRGFKWTARQIALEFGEKNLPECLKEAYQNNAPEKFEILHAIFPRKVVSLSAAKRKSPKGYPWASVYVLRKDKTILHEGGFKSCPFVVPRWTKTNTETYGRSPTMKVLADVKMINEMKKTTLKGAQKTVDPPLQMPDDGFILPLKTTPGGINYYRSGSTDRIETFANNARIDFGFQMISDIKTAIREGYYADQLQLNRGPQMTATEVNARIEQAMRLLGPVLGRLHSELLAPMIERIFEIMVRKGKIEFPAYVQQKFAEKKLTKLSVKYSSPIARAQRISEGQNLNRAAAAIAPVVQVDPTVMDNINGDEVARYNFEIYGVPIKLLRTRDEVKKIREARAKQKMEMAQQQQEQHIAEMTQKMGPAMAQAKQAGVI